MLRVGLGFVVFFVAAGASAQGQSRTTDGAQKLELDYASLERAGERYQLQKEYEALNLNPPRAGVVVSVIGMLSGTILIGAGLFQGSWDSQELSAGGRAMVGAGAVMTVGGFAGLIASAFILSKKKKRRLRLASQLEAP
ncbi:MAG: hypothetical protein WBG86_23240 [Polyangiales bacterium]